MKKGRLVSLLLCTALLFTLLFGCQSAPAGGGGAGDGKIKIAYICKFASSSWFAPKIEAMKARAGELGVELIVLDANNKEDQCIQGVDTALTQQVDGIILTAVNSSLIPPIAVKCREAGVPLMTTDDGGVDDQGKPLPHVGLDDYALGKASAEAMVKEMEPRGFLDDVSKLRIAIIDYPKSESFHKRLLGGYDVIHEKFPQIPEENYLWLDSKDGLVDNVVTVFSNAYQANSTAAKWVILGGDEGSVAGTVPILDENKVDYKNVLFSCINGSNMATDIMSQDPDKANSIFFSGILAKPAGTTCIDVMVDSLKNGTPIPEFTGYPENVCDASNYKKNFADLLE